MDDVGRIIFGGLSVSGCDVDIEGEDHCSVPTPESFFRLDTPVKENFKIIEEPGIGMEFSSDESALKYYTDYGGTVGFKVRKRNLKRSRAGYVTKRTFCCSKEGTRKEDKRRVNVMYRRPVSRVGCKAHLTCKLQKNGKYRIVSYDPNHNHELCRTPVKHMLSSNHDITSARISEEDRSDKSTIPTETDGELTGRRSGDCRNYIRGKRTTTMQKGDAAAILQYFQNMQVENSSYFYSIQLDEDDMITNFFWADARSVRDYGLFGDVVCFDTTCKEKDYGRPFVPIIGVNHHMQIVVFGAAFLYDESIDSFKWLFQTFLGAMSRKPPKTILTDRSIAMAKAISEVFPTTHHRLCLWHIYQNAIKNLSPLFSGPNQFLHDISECIYSHEDASEDEWLLAWNSMIGKYNLMDNIWLKTLFDEKENWAFVYGRHSFVASMKTSRRDDSMNNVLKEYLKPKYNLLTFFEHYERLLAERRYEEQIADFKMVQSSPHSVGMLRHGAEVYTPEVFELFQKEYVNILDCSIYKVGKIGTTSEYKVTSAVKSKEHIVKFEASRNEVVCSCMKFNFMGILCAHALKVLDKKNVKNIPGQYIMERWTRDAKARSASDGNEIHDNPKKSMGYGQLFCNFREISSFAAEHEVLASYAHECSIELLKNLQEMKKKILNPESCTMNSFSQEEIKKVSTPEPCHMSSHSRDGHHGTGQGIQYYNVMALEFFKNNGIRLPLPTRLPTTSMHEKPVPSQVARKR